MIGKMKNMLVRSNMMKMKMKNKIQSTTGKLRVELRGQWPTEGGWRWE